MKKQPVILIIVVLFSVLLLSACGASATPVYLPAGEEADRITTLAQPFAENILKGIETQDYTLFSADFDEAMRKAITEESFNGLVKKFASLGAPDKISLLNIEDQGDFYGVNFGITYSKAALTMRVVLPKADPSKISGLWFK